MPAPAVRTERHVSPGPRLGHRVGLGAREHCPGTQQKRVSLSPMGEAFDWLVDHVHVALFRLGQTTVTPLSVGLLVLAIIVSVVLGRIARAVVTRVLSGPGREGVAYAIGRMAQYLVVVLGVLLGLENAGVSLGALATLGAIVSVGIGFGLQNIAQNFISGVILLIERPIQKGDWLQMGDVEGSVTEIEMRATRVVTRDGVSVLVPNSKLISDEVHNLSAPTTLNRLRISVGAAYGSDSELVRKTLLDVASANDEVVDYPAPLVYFTRFGDSSLDFVLNVWIDNPKRRPDVNSDLHFAIDAAFREAGISMPFPQRDLHLVSGWEKLRAARDEH